jgi:hypothetical protein
VFILGELEGYTGPEIAERLGINLDTAYTRLRTARMQLRRALGTVEEHRVASARIDRGLVLLLPRLTMPGRLGWLGALGAKAKLGLAAGVAGAGLVAVLASGAASTREAPEGTGARGSVAVIAHGADVTASDGASEPDVVRVPPPPSHVPAALAARPASSHPPARSIMEPREVGSADPGSADDDASADLQREVEQLTAARKALTAGRPADALAILEAHARAHPASVLAEGHASLRIASLCAAGRREQARGEAAVLLRRHPGSTLARHAVTRCDEPAAATVAPGTASDR